MVTNPDVSVSLLSPDSFESSIEDMILSTVGSGLNLFGRFIIPVNFILPSISSYFEAIIILKRRGKEEYPFPHKLFRVMPSESRPEYLVSYSTLKLRIRADGKTDISPIINEFYST